MRSKEYYVYILTDENKKAFYIAMTIGLPQRLIEHYTRREDLKTFTGKHQCLSLVFYEKHKNAPGAMERVKKIKSFDRAQKEELIETFNPTWASLNAELVGQWPPEEIEG